MQTILTAIAAVMATVGLLLAAPASAQSASAPDVPAALERINKEFQAARLACQQLAGNAMDVCMEEAKGKQRIAQAELVHSRSGKAEDLLKLDLVRADVAYEIAKERCDHRAGNAKDVCLKEAKADEMRAKAEAQARAGIDVSATVAKLRDADYALAIEKCDALAGEGRKICVDAARTRYAKH